MEKEQFIIFLKDWITKQEAINPEKQIITMLKDIQNAYESIRSDADYSKEVEQLIKLLALQKSKLEQFGNNLETAIESRFRTIDQPLSDNEKNMHFFIGLPYFDDQIDKIKAWAHVYPEFKIMLWYDYNFDLAAKLTEVIEDVTVKNIGIIPDAYGSNFETAKANRILQERKNAYDFVETHLLPSGQFRGMNLEAALSAYLIKYGDMADNGIMEFIAPCIMQQTLIETELKNKLPHTSIELVSFASLSNQDNTQQTLYRQRLILSGNRTHALHTIRMNVLNEHGGMFINPNRIPSYNANLFDLQHIAKAQGLSPNIIDEIIHAAIIKNNFKQKARFKVLENPKHAYLVTKIKMIINHLSSHHMLFPRKTIPTVDPFSGVNYATETDFMISKKGSAFIQDFFAQELKIKTVVDAFPILQLGQPLTREIQAEIDRNLAAQGLSITANELMLYRYEVIKDLVDAPTTKTLAGTPGYNNLFTKNIKKILQKSFKNWVHLMPLAKQKIELVRDIVAPYSQRMCPEAIEDTQPSFGPALSTQTEKFENTSNYSRQIIVQLAEDPVVNTAARMLHGKNELKSSLYVYHPETQKLVEKIATQAKKENENLRIQLVGHGEGLTSEMLRPVIDTLFKPNDKGKILLVENQKVQTLNMVACGFGKYGITTEMQGILADGPLKSLFEYISEKVFLGKLIAKDGSISVATNGRKWIGIIKEDGKYETRLAKTTDKRIVVFQGNMDTPTKLNKSNPIEYKRQAANTGISRPLYKLQSSYNHRFGLYQDIHLVQNSQNETVHLLQGAINTHTANEILWQQKGRIIIDGSPMGLIAAMSMNSYPVMFVDNNLNNLYLIRIAFLQAINTQNIDDWIRNTPCDGNTKKQLRIFFNQKTTLEKERCFSQLKIRINSLAFDFFCGDISNPSLRDEINLYRSQDSLAIIHLEADRLFIKACFETDADGNIGSKKNPYIAKLYVKEKLTVLKQAFDVLLAEPNTSESRLILHNESTNNSKTIVWSKHIPDHIDDFYTRNSYVEKLQNYFSTNSVNVLTRTLKNLFTLSVADVAIRNLPENQNLSSSYVPVLSTLAYNPVSKEHRIVYANSENPEEKHILTTTSPDLAIVKNQLDQQNNALNKSFKYNPSNNQPHRIQKTYQPIGKTGAVSMGYDSASSLVSIWHWLESDITTESSTLSKTLQANTYVSMVQVAYGLTLDTVDTVKWLNDKYILALKPSSASALQSFSRGLRAFVTSVRVLGPFLGFLSLALSVLAYNQAEDRLEKQMLAIEITFGVIGLSLTIGALVAGFMGLTFLVTALGAIGLVLGLASYFILKAIASGYTEIEKIRSLADYFNAMKTGWETGGFKLERGLLIPHEGVLLDSLDLTNPEQATVVFNNQGLKMKSGNSDAHIIPESLNMFLYTLADPASTKKSFSLKNNTGKICSMILPATANAEITPTYKYTTANIDYNNSHFTTVKMFQNKQQGFVFRYRIIKSLPGGIAPPLYFLQQLDFSYKNTNIDVKIGAYDMHFILPGFSQEDQHVDFDKYRKITYNMKSEQITGKSTVVLTLSRAQGNITIDCTNPEITWLIDASRLHGVTLHNTWASSQAHELNFFLTNTTTSDDLLQAEKITKITVLYAMQTTVFLRLQRAHKPFRIEMPDNGLNYIFRMRLIYRPAEGEIPIEYVQKKVKELGPFNIINSYLQIDQFLLNEKLTPCFYLAQKKQVVYLKDSDRHEFGETKLLFYNQFYAFFQGNITVHYKNTDIFGVKSHVFYDVFFNVYLANMSYQFFFPLLQIQSNNKEFYESANSSIIQTQVLEKGILIKQRFTTLCGKSIELTYLIHTQNPKYYLLEVEGLEKKAGLAKSEIKALTLKSLYGFMKKSVQKPVIRSKSAALSIDYYNFPSISAKEADFILPLRLTLPANNNRIWIGDRLIFPPNSIRNVGENQIIIAYFNDGIDYNEQYHASLVNVVKSAENDTDIHYFWEITDLHNSNQFYRLYKQKKDDYAAMVALEIYGLEASKIKRSFAANLGVYLETYSGSIYLLNMQGVIVLQSIDVQNIPDSRIDLTKAIITEITRIKTEQTTRKYKEGVTELIFVAPIISIDGLLQNDGKTTLPVWYDTNQNQFFMYQTDASTKVKCLGSANDDGQGIWLLTNKNNVKQIAYLATANPFNQTSLFNNYTLASTNNLPTPVPLLITTEGLAQEAGKLPQGEIIKHATAAANGHLNIETDRGLYFDITANLKENTTTFEMTLSSIIQVFPVEYNLRDLVDLYFPIGLKNTVLPEILLIQIGTKSVTWNYWYHPKSKQLIRPNEPASNLRYLGFDEKLYFNIKGTNQLLAIEQTGWKHVGRTQEFPITTAYPPLTNGIYSRQDNVLYWNANFLTKPDPYLNLEEANTLLIHISQQRKNFVFILENFRYDIIVLLYSSETRYVDCRVNNRESASNMVMMRKREQLVLYIAEKELIIDAAFAANNVDFNNLFLTFTHFRGVTIKELVDYYNAYTKEDPWAEVKVCVPYALTGYMPAAWDLQGNYLISNCN